jgi:hypothetical protein
MNPPDLDQPVALDHLERMTDCFGLIQHANYALPDYRTGYTTDDNARALVVAAKYYQLYQQPSSLHLIERYLSFLIYAQTPEGRFHNFIGFDRRPMDTVGSEDAFGRAFWALAHVLLYAPRPDLVRPAERMLHDALPQVERLVHPRSKAYCLAGLYWWAQSARGDVARAKGLARPLADYLVNRCHESRRAGWDWVLPEFTYANASLPEGLFRAYQLLGDDTYLATAEQTMGFLSEATFGNDIVTVVGNKEWLEPNLDLAPAAYDQQPIEAGLMVEACLAGYEATGRPEYLRDASRALGWFYGANLLRLSLYDPETEGCFDALMETGVNENRGAESTVSLLLARLGMAEARRRLASRALEGEEVGRESLRLAGPGS